jgi:hypothetical protein
MTRLEFVDLLVDLLLGILYRLTHLVSGLVRLVGDFNCESDHGNHLWQRLWKHLKILWNH